MPDPDLLADAPVVYAWRYDLASSPEALWPLVSDTNRMNRIAQMAPVRFDEAADGERTGHATMLGMGVSWDEHPFEWQHPVGFSVRRDLRNGVLRAYRSSVTLEPAGTGTRLHHRVELVPRLGLMAPFVRREGTKLERQWGHAYRAVDAWLAGTGPDPFSPAKAPRRSPAARAVPEAVFAEADEPALARRLFDHVLRADAAELVHVRPFMLADAWRHGREATLLACLQLTRRALLLPQWSLLCPHCRGAKGTAGSLEALPDTVRCASCNLDVGRLADDVVELSFRPDPRYRAVGETTFCVGGPGSTPHICWQSRLAPGVTREIGVAVPGGGYRLRAARVAPPFDFQYHPGEAPPPLDVGDAAPPRPTVAIQAGGVVAQVGDPRHLDGEKLRLVVMNDTEHAQDVVVETRSWREDVVTLAWLKRHPAYLLPLTNDAGDEIPS